MFALSVESGEVRKMQSEQKFSISPKSAAVITTLAGLSLGMAARPAEAVVYLDSSTDASHVSAALAFQGKLVWMEGYTQGSTTPFYTSGTILDSRNILFTAHQTFTGSAPITYTSVGTGSNFITSPGNTVAVSDVVVDPGYVAGGGTPDFAIAHLATPLSIVSARSSFASVSQGEELSAAGFGVWGTPKTGLHLQDGNSRAWTAPVDQNAGAYSSDLYFTAEFFIDGSLGPLNGKGANLDSGSPWLNSAGELVGISDAVSSGPGGGNTYVERLSQPDSQNWINANEIAVPEPTSLAALALTGAALLRRRRNA